VAGMDVGMGVGSLMGADVGGAGPSVSDGAEACGAGGDAGTSVAGGACCVGCGDGGAVGGGLGGFSGAGGAALGRGGGKSKSIGEIVAAAGDGELSGPEAGACWAAAGVPGRARRSSASAIGRERSDRWKRVRGEAETDRGTMVPSWLSRLCSWKLSIGVVLRA